MRWRLPETPSAAWGRRPPHARPRPLPVEAARTHEKLKTQWKETGSITPAPVRQETPEERFRKAMLLQNAIDQGRPVDAHDAVWLGRYQETPEFKSHASLAKDFPEVLPHELRGGAPTKTPAAAKG